MRLRRGAESFGSCQGSAIGAGWYVANVLYELASSNITSRPSRLAMLLAAAPGKANMLENETHPHADERVGEPLIGHVLTMETR